MDPKRDRELQRLADAGEQLGSDLAEVKRQAEALSETVYGNPHAVPKPTPGLVHRVEDLTARWERLMWAGGAIVTAASALGLFVADIGKDVVKRWIVRLLFP